MNCPACASRPRLLIRRGLLPSGLAVCECRRCGMGFFESPPEDDYWGTAGQAAIYDDAAIAAARAEAFERILGEIEKLKSPGRLLDVGAGKGEFALVASTRGWRASVVEPSASATAGLEGRGVAEVFNTTFEAFEPRGKYDCVTLLDFIEHTRNPLAVMKKAVRCLADGGVLVVLTPDGGSIPRRAAVLLARGSARLSGLLKYLYYLPHLSYLGAKGLSRLAAESDLDVLCLRRLATPRRFLSAKLRTHYGKYPGNEVFRTLVAALYPLAAACVPNKLFAIARKAPR